MVFSSTLFLAYFLPIFLLAYWLTPARYRNWTALLASTIFYAWGAPLFVFAVYGSMILDYWLVGKLRKSERKKLIIWTSVVLNVGLLAYFKYSNFFVENLNAILKEFGSDPMTWLNVALPIGISFFTFQKLSYTLDVYRGKHEALESFADYALYIILFPQLIAGPIVRFNEIADQLINRKSRENVDNRLLGFFRFTIGLSKKVLIANVLGEVADMVFSMPTGQLSISWAWTGILAYTFQIYFDFSGYSDMAIGLGRMMGFVFPENFNNPYISGSITEFWQRWHMTLSRWMKDYLYIPLGGNRKGNSRTYINLWTVFLISGLWHGASWTFVVWGAYHGLFLVLERLFLIRIYNWMGRIPSTVITFFIAVLGWVVFRADNIGHAQEYFVALFSFSDQLMVPRVGKEFWYTLVVAVAFSFIAVIPWVGKLQDKLLLNDSTNLISHLLKTIVAVALFVFSLSMIISSGFNPFIYFRF